MPEGKYFYIESRMCGLVLDISGNSTEPGAGVVTWEKKPVEEADNQLWYQDYVTGTIRTKLNDFCLDVSNQDIVINPYNPGDSNQQWEFTGSLVRCRDGRCIDIEAANSDPGTKVLAWEEHGNDNQQWNQDFILPRYFYIKSQMNGKVLDVKGASEDPGAEVIMWTQHSDLADNQLWYEGRDGTIRCKLNDFVLDASDEKIKTGLVGSNPNKQSWHYHDERILNRYEPNSVLDICGECDDEGAELVPYDWHGGSNQKWTLEWV